MLGFGVSVSPMGDRHYRKTDGAIIMPKLEPFYLGRTLPRVKSETKQPRLSPTECEHPLSELRGGGNAFQKRVYCKVCFSQWLRIEVGNKSMTEDEWTSRELGEQDLKTMNFGKHKGKQYWQAHEDSGYVDWIKKQVNEYSSPGLKAFALYCQMRSQLDSLPEEAAKPAKKGVRPTAAPVPVARGTVRTRSQAALSVASQMDVSEPEQYSDWEVMSDQ